MKLTRSASEGGCFTTHEIRVFPSARPRWRFGFVSETMIKAVVFDLDGLMFNTEEIFHEAGIELMRRHGREMTDEFFTIIMGRLGGLLPSVGAMRLGILESLR